MTPRLLLSNADKRDLITYAAKARLSRALGRRPHQVNGYRRSAASEHLGALSRDEVAEITAGEVKKVGQDYIQRSLVMASLGDSPARWPMQHSAAVTTQAELIAHPEIKTIANIGARVDLVSAYLAPRFAERQFISVDFQPDLARHNEAAQPLANRRFMSGYALDLIASGDLVSDAVVMTSTATLIRPAEWACYVHAMDRRGVSLVIINEPYWWDGFAVTYPRAVVQLAGDHGNYHYDFTSELRHHGYEITTSEIERIHGEFYCVWRIVAHKKK